MNHRHLLVPTDTPAEELPSAAIVDILERGDLADWQPLAEAIAHDPQGELADRVAHLVDSYPMYGTSALWRAWIDRCRARAEGGQRPRQVAELSALRRELGLTQVELAGLDHILFLNIPEALFLQPPFQDVSETGKAPQVVLD
ncbi:MAG: hypothetical protein WBI00_10840, partial [Thermoanaerobaculia bacterium]